MEKKLQYTVKEVAYMADKAEVTIRRQISERVISAVKVGGSVRVPHRELVRYLGEDPFNADNN